MGTTSEKLTYLNETKQELKQKINNLGGSITDETTFRQYVNQLDGVYDVLPKTEFQEGTSVTIENGLKGKIDFDDGKVGFGQASQDTTNGYQLYLLPPSKTLNGITYTNNGDGTCDIVGTATANVDFALATRMPIAESPLVLGESYNISVLEALPDVTFQVVEYASNGTWIATTGLVRNTQSQNITIPNNSNTAFIDYNIRVYSGATVNAKGIKLMMNTGTSRKDFEQYTGGYASPSPNWEQEVKCVAGRNLYNKDKTPDNYYYDGSGQKVYVSNNDFINQEYNLRGTVTISFDSKSSNSAYVRVCEYEGSTFIRRTLASASGIYPLSTNCDRVIFSVDNSESVYFTNLQIEQGSTAHPYLPYNTIEIVESGKNLWGLEKRVYSDQAPQSVTATISNGKLTATGTSTAHTAYAISVEIGEKYTIAWKNATGLNSVQVGNGETDIGTQYFRNYNATGLEVITANTNSLYMKILSSGTTLTIDDVMVVKGEYTSQTIGDYEPYVTPRTYKFSLGDHKFYGIGTYRDYILRTTGKNLAQVELEGKYREYRYGTIQTNADFNGYIASVKPNTSYIANGNGLSVNPARLSNLCFFDSQMTYIDGNAFTGTDKTFITPNNCYYVTIAVSNYISNFQIEEGSTASDYQPYGVGNWYKAGKVAELSARNSTIIYDATLTNVSRFRIAISGAVGFVDNGYCNYLKCENGFSLDEQHFYIFNGNLFFFIPNSIAQNLSQLETWLNSNDLKFYYPLVSPTYTPITGDLATQLEAFWNGQSNNGTTIIESNGDLPMIIKVRALKGE